MTLEAQYTRILEKGRDKELFSFLQSITPEERRSLAPTVKKLAKEYLAYRQQGNTWGSKATENQREILNYSFFGCYNKKEIEKENPAWILGREHLEKFLYWYCPSWLSDYINSFAERDWLPYQLDYDYLVELEQRELIQPSPQLLARVLVPVVYENKDRQNHFVPERLLKYDVTLKEHVWYLFQYETTLHASNQYLYYNGKRIEHSWLDVFQNYVSGGRLERQRLLQEALLASNRNFNKNLSGWFAELFLQLKPSAEEVLVLQPELFNLFAAPHSKVVTTALQACKLIVDQPNFDYDGFLDSVPILLSSATKTVVSSTLQLLEKLAKKHAEKRTQICELATGAFIHKEDSLQTRAAKLIQKFGNPGDGDLKAVLLQYGNALFSGAKTLLQPYLPLEEIPGEIVSVNATMKAPYGSLTTDTALPLINTVDELIFLTAQAFDNNESWHMDVLPAALIRIQGAIRGEHLQKMEPAIQRALKLYFGDWRSSQGELDFLLACFFLDYGLWLVEQYGDEGATARKLYGSFLSKSEQNKKVWEEHGTSTTFLGSWKGEERRFLYSAYYKLLEAVLFSLKNRIDLPLLCEPTHAPAWIDPSVLVERLYLYQQKGSIPDNTDLQMALSRCWLHGTENAIQMAMEKLQGELRELMLFLLDKDQHPTGPFNMEAAWMIAALSKSPATIYPELQGLFYSQKPRQLYTGQYPYQIQVETYTYQDHHWENGKLSQVQKAAQRKVIRLDLSAQQAQKPKEASGLKKFFNKLTGKEEVKQPELPPLIYDYLRSKERWLSLEDRDIRRLYLIMPNNPEPLLAFVIDKCLSDPSSFGETAKRLVIRVLEVLLQTWRPVGEMGHLFVATCLLSPDKTVATYATEIWLQGVDQGNIDSERLGTILGKHERIEFAPLKRFTDLAVQSLFNISPLHNKALELMLAALLIELPEKPIKGLKKLLEIYIEVLKLNTAAVTRKEVKVKLAQWKESSGLRNLWKEEG
jgi:hypothetical protein